MHVRFGFTFVWLVFVLFLGIYCVDILKHNCGFNHVNVLFLTTMFVKCNQSLFLLHGHRRTNNFTFLFIFGCFFVLFFAFSLLPLVVVRLFLDSYVVFFFSGVSCLQLF